MLPDPIRCRPRARTHRLAPGTIDRFIVLMKAPPSSQEEQLSAAIREVAESRNIEAFRRLFDHYAPRLKAYLRKVGAADEATDDLVQEVLLSVWRRAHQFDPNKAALSTWIFTIARNKRIDVLRRDRRPEAELAAPPVPGESPMRGDQALELQQLSQQLTRALGTLPKEQSELLKIFYYEEKSHSAIAEELGLPLGTVKSRLRLALGKLRTIIGGPEQ
jgi:RNA polymerase sigma-70 factor (ECF subfamily)